MVADHVLCPRCRHANAPENRFCGSCGASFEASGELVGYIRWETMREHVMREVANRAATDPEFLGQARRDLDGALAQYGYHLTDEELRLVKDLQRQTAEMSDKELARTLAGGLEGRTRDGLKIREVLHTGLPRGIKTELQAPFGRLECHQHERSGVL